MTDTDTGSTTGLTEAEAAEFRQKCVDFMEQYGTKPAANLDDQKAFLAAGRPKPVSPASRFPPSTAAAARPSPTRRSGARSRATTRCPTASSSSRTGCACRCSPSTAPMNRRSASLPTTFPARRCGADVLRAGRRLRRRQPADQGRTRRRRMGPQRPEGLDHTRPQERLRPRGRGSDPDQVKHAGISTRHLDIAARGVEIRPIHWHRPHGVDFDEAFMSDADIPKRLLVGTSTTAEPPRRSADADARRRVAIAAPEHGTTNRRTSRCCARLPRRPDRSTIPWCATR